MKTLALGLVVLGFALAAVPAYAAQEGATSFTLVAKNPEFYWHEEGQTTQNPTLEIAGGQTITVTVKNDPEQDGFHSLKVGDHAQSDNIESAGDSVTYTFTAPESGNVEYVCPYHPTTMKGQFHVAGSSVTGEANNESPAFGLIGAILALVGVAFVVRRS